MRRALTAVAALGVLALAGCSDDASQANPEADTWVQDQASWDGQPSVDPYTSTGVWAVPDNIAPGRYAITAGTGTVTSLRWVSVCRDRWCDQPISEFTEYAPDGGGQKYINVPSDGSVQAVNNNGVVLTKVE